MSPASARRLAAAAQTAYPLAAAVAVASTELLARASEGKLQALGRFVNIWGEVSVGRVVNMGGSERRQRGVACPPTVPSFGLGFSQCGRFAPLRISQGGRLAPLGISQCGWSVPFGLGQCGVCLHRDESLWMVCTSALTPQNNPQMLHNGEYIPLAINCTSRVLQSLCPEMATMFGQDPPMRFKGGCCKGQLCLLVLCAGHMICT